MIRFFLRLLALVCLSVAVVAAVVDATRSVAASEFVFTPLGQGWGALSASTLQTFVDGVAGVLPEAIAGPVLGGLLAIPGWGVFGVLAFLFHLLAAPSRRRSGRPIAPRRDFAA